MRYERSLGLGLVYRYGMRTWAQIMSPLFAEHALRNLLYLICSSCNELLAARNSLAQEIGMSQNSLRNPRKDRKYAFYACLLFPWLYHLAGYFSEFLTQKHRDIYKFRKKIWLSKLVSHRLACYKLFQHFLHLSWRSWQVWYKPSKICAAFGCLVLPHVRQFLGKDGSRCWISRLGRGNGYYIYMCSTNLDPPLGDSSLLRIVCVWRQNDRHQFPENYIETRADELHRRKTSPKRANGLQILMYVYSLKCLIPRKLEWM